MSKKTTPHTAHRATKVARRMERATRPTPGAPPPDTTKRPLVEFGMTGTRVVGRATEARHSKLPIDGRNHIPAQGRILKTRHRRETDLRESMREAARGEESVTKAAKALGVSHRTAASLRGAVVLPAKERARIHRERLRAA